MYASEPVTRIAEFKEPADILRALEEYRFVVQTAHQNSGLDLRQAGEETRAYEARLGLGFVNEALALATMRDTVTERVMSSENCTPDQTQAEWTAAIANDAGIWVDEAQNLAMWDNFEKQFDTNATGSEANQ